MIRREKFTQKKPSTKKRNSNDNDSDIKTNKKRNIYRENGPERKKKRLIKISRMKKGPIDINIKIKRDKSTSFFLLLKSAF